eukprot:107398-Prorocentrum_minimum.AAC.1
MLVFPPPTHPLNSTAVGNRCNEANHVPPLRTVHLDSRSVVGAEALGRLCLTKLPPTLPLRIPYAPPTHPIHTMDTSWVPAPAYTRSLAPSWDS